MNAPRIDNALAPAPSAGIMRLILEKKRAIALWSLSSELEQTFSQQADTLLIVLSLFFLSRYLFLCFESTFGTMTDFLSSAPQT